jgi:hypothetical protein
MQVSGQLKVMAGLPPRGNIPLYPLDGRLGGPQSWSGCCAVEKKYLAPGRNQTRANQPTLPFSKSLMRILTKIIIIKTKLFISALAFAVFSPGTGTVILMKPLIH